MSDHEEGLLAQLIIEVRAASQKLQKVEDFINGDWQDQRANPGLRLRLQRIEDAQERVVFWSRWAVAAAVMAILSFAGQVGIFVLNQAAK